MEQERLCSALESILFAAEHPVSITRFQDVFGEEGPEKEKIEEALESVRLRYKDEIYGFELREAQSGFHFVTKPQNADLVRTFLATKPFRISKSASEVLAIVAYRQPITRADVDQIRGIDSSHIMRVLMERGIVKMAGKAEVPGRPVQYGTTDRFLEIMGLKSLNDLPPLSELEQLQGHAEPARDPMEVGLERFIKDSGVTGKMEEATLEELSEISDMIADAEESTDTEVYESQDHRDVAAANKEAVDGLKNNLPKRKKKKKEVRYEDLVPSQDSNPEMERALEKFSEDIPEEQTAEGFEGAVTEELANEEQATEFFETAASEDLSPDSDAQTQQDTEEFNEASAEEQVMEASKVKTHSSSELERAIEEFDEEAAEEQAASTSDEPSPESPLELAPDSQERPPELNN